MSDDIAMIRARLTQAWQKAARDLTGSGVPGKAVFETLMAVGLAGHVELYGKRGAAAILLALVDTLDKEAGAEAAEIRRASAEARGATRN